MQESAIDSAIRRFVQKLDALQRQRNNRVTLEEIVEALARTGISAAGVAEVLRSIYYEGIASWGTSPNPADYNRPLILIYLNREHAIVRAARCVSPFYPIFSRSLAAWQRSVEVAQRTPLAERLRSIGRDGSVVRRQ